MKHEIWTIAYRKKNSEKYILENTEDSFKIIPNTWRYWCADPHLWVNQGKTYVFAELYDRVLRRGVIGYCEIIENGVTPWKVVLKTDYHLSYPHVFSDGKDVYMIPESYVAKEIALFKAISFPEKWEKISVLKKDFVAVDSTLFSYNDKLWMLTMHSEGEHENLELFEVGKEYEIKAPYCESKDDLNKRPAGKLFMHKGQVIRPAQDCTKGYGCALNLYEVLNVEEGKYEERLIKKIKPEEIRSDFKGKPEGIHTYNQNESYEIIDLKSYEIDWLFYVMRPIWFVWRRIKR